MQEATIKVCQRTSSSLLIRWCCFVSVSIHCCSCSSFLVKVNLSLLCTSLRHRCDSLCTRLSTQSVSILIQTSGRVSTGSRLLRRYQSKTRIFLVFISLFLMFSLFSKRVARNGLRWLHFVFVVVEDHFSTSAVTLWLVTGEMRCLHRANHRPHYFWVATCGAERSSLWIGSSWSLGIVGLLRRADESFYRARTSLFPLGSSSLLGHNPPHTLPFRSGTTTDGGQLAELLQARYLSAGLGAQLTSISGRRRGSKPDLTPGGLRHREEKIWRGGQEVFKVPKDTPL